MDKKLTLISEGTLNHLIKTGDYKEVFRKGEEDAPDNTLYFSSWKLSNGDIKERFIIYGCNIQYQINKKENMESFFKKELEKLINKFSEESESNTPDYILADYMAGCLENFSRIMKNRDKCRDEQIKSNIIKNLFS